MGDRQARITLSCLVEPGTAGLAGRVAEHGAQQVLAEVLAGPRRHRCSQVEPADVPAMLRKVGARGVRVLVEGDPEYPSQLLDLPEPPLALWVRGPLDLRMAALRSVAVVGSRACTPYGERATAQVVGGLAERGWTVVSGAAFGIDAAAHRAALCAEGPTVAVLACGVDVAYPLAHGSLLGRIGDTGAIVAELPPGSPALKHRFLARNRLIAALSRGTVVVEAAQRSGALATANRALELGRVLMAVPGPITAMASSGTNRLLHEQSARAVTDAQQVIDLLVGAGSQLVLPGLQDGGTTGLQGPAAGTVDLGPQIAAVLGGDPGSEAAPVLGGDLGPEIAAVLGALRSGRGQPLQRVAQRAGVSEGTCTAALGLLELSGLARRTTLGWRR